jgi:hypothetical protein
VGVRIISEEIVEFRSYGTHSRNPQHPIK